MCKITKEMVQAANEFVMENKSERHAVAKDGGFSVFTTFKGKVFEAHFSKEDIEFAGNLAFQKVMCG